MKTFLFLGLKKNVWGEEGNFQVLELDKEKSTDAAFVGSSEAPGYCLFGGGCLQGGEQKWAEQSEPGQFFCYIQDFTSFQVNL